MTPTGILRDTYNKVPTMEPTGYSAPPSAHDRSMNNSVCSSATPVCAPLKKLRATPAVPALVATLENIEQRNQAPRATLNVSSGSEIFSIASSQERNQRVALAKAWQHTARLSLELAENQARLRLELASRRRRGAARTGPRPSRLTSRLGRTSNRRTK